MSEIKGNYALVTGGTSGMGLEYVRQLAERGYNVIIAALPGKTPQLEPSYVAETLSKEYPSLDFLPVPINLARVQAAGELLEVIHKERPGAFIEVLINNAGILHPMHFYEMTLDQVQMELLLHNLTVSSLCHLLLPEMKAKGRGYVLNISSLAAWLPFPFISTYCATKSYNRMLTRALRTEYWGTGVYVATIYFGAVDTPLFNLKPSYRKLAKNLSVMITPQKAVSIALDMLFKGKSGKMPGLLNKISAVLLPLLPRRLVVWIDKKISAKLSFE